MSEKMRSELQARGSRSYKVGSGELKDARKFKVSRKPKLSEPRPMAKPKTPKSNMSESMKARLQKEAGSKSYRTGSGEGGRKFKLSRKPKTSEARPMAKPEVPKGTMSKGMKKRLKEAGLRLGL